MLAQVLDSCIYAENQALPENLCAVPISGFIGVFCVLRAVDRSLEQQHLTFVSLVICTILWVQFKRFHETKRSINRYINWYKRFHMDVLTFTFFAC